MPAWLPEDAAADAQLVADSRARLPKGGILTPATLDGRTADQIVAQSVRWAEMG
jgi:hypothetical protein